MNNSLSTLTTFWESLIEPYVKILQFLHYEVNLYDFIPQVVVAVNGDKVLNTQLIEVFRMWEETSYRLERLQANTECVEQEWRGTN